MSTGIETDDTATSGPRGTWMISFVDLISVLLTFMIMLYAISESRDVAAWRGTDRLSETIDWRRQLPARAARNSAEAVRSLPAMDLEYLEGVLAAALADEPVSPTIIRRDDRLILALPPPVVTATLSGVQALALGEAEQRILRTLARPLNGLSNRLEVHGLTVPIESVGEGYGDTTAAPPAAAWAAGIQRAVTAAAVLAEGGLERPVGCYGLADLPPHRLRVTLGNRRHPPASRIHVVVLAGAGE